MFVERLFGRDGLEASWHWYRFEWQRRGNIHLHGMARLKGVDFQPLAKLVDKGRKSLLLLHVLKGTREDLVNVLGDLQELRSYDDIATTPSMLAFAESAQIDQLEVERQ